MIVDDTFSLEQETNLKALCTIGSLLLTLRIIVIIIIVMIIIVMIIIVIIMIIVL